MRKFRTKLSSHKKVELLKNIQMKEKEGWECVSKVQREKDSSFYNEIPKWFVIMEREYDGDEGNSAHKRLFKHY